MIRHGLHLSIASKEGVAGAVREAELLGLSAFQIFAKSPRAWKTRPLSPAQIERFRARRENLGAIPAVIHASYLVNLGASGVLWEKSVFSLADDLMKAQALGVGHVVVHPGSGDAERVREGALKARELAALGKNGPKLLLENSAGGGRELGSDLYDLARLIEGTPLGVCFDTCHAFAAGYRIHEDPAGVLSVLEEIIGLGRVPVIHLNDSQHAFASHKDLHANLLEGYIGPALAEFVTDSRLSGKVVILETPRSLQEDAHNLRVLREWLRG
ncbi:deoxyribonuclease IV [Calidithermus timidus]|jgi:deoxyribonuclease-4|uniref:deoxyribonuclease IV n=1 Tax=Calidithermus timidus TaxID=307124 RepID=UPI00035C6ADC|nr:deoxyribonuclease IV [Calidithermus timidus]